MIEKAWKGLRAKFRDNRGIGYCAGTSHGLDRQTYPARPHDFSRTSRSSMRLSWIKLQRMRPCPNAQGCRKSVQFRLSFHRASA